MRETQPKMKANHAKGNDTTTPVYFLEIPKSPDMVGGFNINILFPSEGFKKGSEARLSEAVHQTGRRRAHKISKHANRHVWITSKSERFWNISFVWSVPNGRSEFSTIYVDAAATFAQESLYGTTLRKVTMRLLVEVYRTGWLRWQATDKLI